MWRASRPQRARRPGSPISVPITGWREGFERLVAAVEAMGPNDQLRHLATHNIVGQLSTRLRFVEE